MRRRIDSSPEKGFTFVEVLAAMLFLAIVVPAIVSALTLSNRASEITDRGTTAGQLAENKLNELLIGNAWVGTNGGGDFGADHPGYRWTMTQTPWQGDVASQMTEIKVEVFYPVQGRERSVALTTLASATATMSSTGVSVSSGTGKNGGTQ